MKADWVCDEEGLICSVCGKDIYHCECPDGNGGQGKMEERRRERAMKALPGYKLDDLFYVSAEENDGRKEK